jgi:hypothetical protein
MDGYRRAMSVPERAENCGRQRSLTDIANSFRSGHGLVDQLRETYFGLAVSQSDALAVAPLGELGVERCNGSLGSRGQQVLVYLVSDVDVPMSKEVG